MTTPALPRPKPAENALYTEIRQFYAYQMQLLDQRACEEWAATFTEDGVFAANGLPEPSKGRANIAAAATAARARLAEAGIEHRHWLDMLVVDQQDDGTVRTRSYALVIQIPRGGQPELHRSTVCEDVLVRAEDGSLLVRDRRVTRDDLA